MFEIRKSTEEEIIGNHKPDFLYSHNFEAGRFFQVVHNDEAGFEIKLAAKTMLKAIYIKENDDIEGIEIIKVIGGSETQKVKLSKFNLAQIKAFLSFISQIDLKGISEKRLKLFDENDLDDDTIKTLKTLLAKEGGSSIIETLINEGIITSKDIVNTGFRKRGLEIFNKLLSDQEYWKSYCSENGLTQNSEEKAWQYFFTKNQWIFGYGLEYKFKGILQKEFHASDTDADGSNGVISDFLLGDKRFTTFVEIKKPTTPLFGRSKNRANAWSLSNDLFDSVSQILEQKASGQDKIENNKKLFTDEGIEITQRAFDSKVILLIGTWDELSTDVANIKEIKTRTFELFRRDSRNIEIITFDELLDRAKYILAFQPK